MNVQTTISRTSFATKYQLRPGIRRAKPLTSHVDLEAKSKAASALAPASTAPVTTPADLSVTLAWVSANREQYLGKWVALRGDELVAAADTFKELRAKLVDVPNPSSVVIDRVFR